MNSLFLFIFLKACGAVLLLDGMGAIISNKFKIDYSWFTIGSLIIYATLAVQMAKSLDLASGLLANALLGIFDGTLGVVLAKAFDPYITSINKEEFRINLPMTIAVALMGVLIGFFSIKIFTPY